jgi:hypothetical protein
MAWRASHSGRNAAKPAAANSFQRGQQLGQQHGIQRIFVGGFARRAQRGGGGTDVRGQICRQVQVDADADHGGMRRAGHQLDQDAAELAAVLEDVVGPFQRRPASADFLQRARHRDADGE